jgi:hypothetical protein
MPNQNSKKARLELEVNDKQLLNAAAAMTNFQKAGTNTASSLSAGFSHLNSEMGQATKFTNMYTMSLGPATKSTREFGGALNDKQLRMSAISMRYFMQDAPYLFNNFNQGIMAVSNNIPMLTESILAVRQQTGSWGAALTALKTQLIGVGGIAFAVTTLVALMQVLSFTMAKSARNSKANAKTNNELAASLREITAMQENYSKALARTPVNSAATQTYFQGMAMGQSGRKSNTLKDEIAAKRGDVFFGEFKSLMGDDSINDIKEITRILSELKDNIPGTSIKEYLLGTDAAEGVLQIKAFKKEVKDLYDLIYVKRQDTTIKPHDLANVSSSMPWGRDISEMGESREEQFNNNMASIVQANEIVMEQFQQMPVLLDPTWDAIRNGAKTAADTLRGSLLVALQDGKNLAEAMEIAFKSMIINMVAELLANAAIFMLLSAFGVPMGKFSDFSGGFSGKVGKALGFAEGGISTQPTAAMFAEAGVPEAAIPLNQRGVEFLQSAMEPFAVGGAGSRGGITVVVKGAMEGQTFLQENYPEYDRARRERVRA